MRIYLAPMEGITTFVYRNALHRHYGGVDKYFTPFIASKNLNYKEINDIAPEHNQNIPLVPQILANQAETFLAIVEQLADYGYTEVNLNLGCPSGTVVSRKRGAGFLSVPWLLDAFLEEIFEKCPLKISIKTRIGILSMDEWEELLEIYAKYPLSELIIHPRFQREFYNGTPHAEAFRLAQDRLSVPLVYNGDLFSADSLAKLQQQTASLEAVMLGRGAISNPELPGLLASGAASSQAPAQPSSGLQTSSATKDWETFWAFHDEILAGYLELMSGEQPALFRMKELWTYLGNYLGLSDKQMKSLRKTKHMSEYRELIKKGCCKTLNYPVIFV